jgi:hypothetical protein
MEAWLTVLKGDPLPWLLEKETPAVRHLALRRLLDEPPDSAAVRRARAAAMRSDPIAAILAAQDALLRAPTPVAEVPWSKLLPHLPTPSRR